MDELKTAVTLFCSFIGCPVTSASVFGCPADGRAFVLQEDGQGWIPSQGRPLCGKRVLVQGRALDGIIVCAIVFSSL
ncbi:hypothetical protein CEXT_745751 [Caerostris extrusa]|uniref:Uncharacterized protein n=1 Tax=Caerostris extrusa TaxID=172846 RepID=A0AAV4TQ90_CAEEX|nr:hypothetical protein CEXT_745751 [Caerostris extrusa]